MVRNLSARDMRLIANVIPNARMCQAWTCSIKGFMRNAEKESSAQSNG